MTTQSSPVIQLVLESFQHELRRLRDGWLSRKLMGVSPTEGFVSQLSEIDERGRASGSVLGVWRITATEVEALPPAFNIPPISAGNGLYFDRGSFRFAVSADGRRVTFGIQVGPRFGRGYQCEVANDDKGSPRFKSSKGLWKS